MLRFLPAILLLSSTCVGGDLHFSNVRVFDGERLLDAREVLVRDGVIQKIGNQLDVPEGVQRVDGNGKTLLPGLIDSHTHSFMEAHLRQAIHFGVTTELDMMSVPRAAAAFRQAQQDGRAGQRADLFSAGAAVTVPDGHGTEYGFEVPTLTSPEDADAFVKARVEEGSDYIKIIHDDGAAYGIPFETLTPDMIQEAIKAAHKYEKLAVAHVGARWQAQDVVLRGIDGLVHIFADEPFDEMLLGYMKEHDVFIVPTTAVISGAIGHSTVNSILEDPHLSALLTSENVANLKRTFPVIESTYSWERLSANIRKAYEGGIPILAGTDAANPATVHGASLHHELELLVATGLPNKAVLAAATSLPAKHFGLDDRGQIAVGRRADLVLVIGNPLEDIRATRNIDSVWKAGVLIKRSERMERVARQREEAAARKENAETMLVSDFESGNPDAELGMGWSVSTDSIMGGSSRAELEVVDGGANETRRCLKVSGNVQSRKPSFAGTIFSPGDGPMEATDLSGHRGIAFWAKSDAKITFQAMIFTESLGFQPSVQTFEATPTWQRVDLDFADFGGVDSSEISGIWLGTISEGEFELQIDEFELSGGDEE